MLNLILFYFFKFLRYSALNCLSFLCIFSNFYFFYCALIRSSLINVYKSYLNLESEGRQLFIGFNYYYFTDLIYQYNFPSNYIF